MVPKGPPTVRPHRNSMKMFIFLHDKWKLRRRDRKWRDFLHVSFNSSGITVRQVRLAGKNSATRTREAQAWHQINNMVQWVTLRGSPEWNQAHTFDVYFHIQVVNEVEKSIHWESTRKEAVKLRHSVPTVTHQQVHLLGLQWFYSHMTADGKNIMREIMWRMTK